jgi:hypothetical protein
MLNNYLFESNLFEKVFYYVFIIIDKIEKNEEKELLLKELDFDKIEKMIKSNNNYLINYLNFLKK